MSRERLTVKEFEELYLAGDINLGSDRIMLATKSFESLEKLNDLKYIPSWATHVVVYKDDTSS